MSLQPEAKRTKISTPRRKCIVCWVDRGIKRSASYGFEYRSKRLDCAEHGRGLCAFNVNSKRCEDCLAIHKKEHRNTPIVCYGLRLGYKHARWCSGCARKHDTFHVACRRCEDCIQIKKLKISQAPICTYGLIYGQKNARWCKSCGINIKLSM